MAKSTGTVKWFSGQKGFGFIAPDSGEEDVFVHQTEIRSEGFRTLREGQKVEFVLESGDDGRSKAIDVVGVATAPRSGGTRGGRSGRGRGSYGGGRGGEGVECYNCGRTGHLARDCFRSSGGGRELGVGRGGGQDYGGRRGGGGRGYGGGRDGGGGGRGGVCYNCGEGGHFARDCKIRT